ncbi:AraC family transcriptional regulator [Hymenobacter sp. BT664]|uniref:AraC family transcriptional regulator n=1 Tax=Hymenobacter montanus TaxID=2771359 RepID=A0A927B9H7_9BACT|nr:helix-turn-helix domain-containing protein [Hymenobacter montanus]MBD2766610.1 AraC family transcriptional regulator [Hymenobacter montanus]
MGIAAVILAFTSNLLFVIREDRNHNANTVFALFLLLLAATLLNDVLGSNHAFDYFPFLYEYDRWLIFCLGPLLYLYVLYLTKPYFQLRPRFCGHFVIVVPHALIAWSFWKENGLAKLEAFPILRYQNFAYAPVLEYLPKVQLVAYLLLCFYRVERHNRVIRELMSSVEQATLAWLRSLLLALFALFAAWVLVGVSGIPNTLLGVVAVLVSYWLSWQALTQKAIYPVPQPAQVFEMAEAEPTVRYSNSPLAIADIQPLMHRVEACMQESKPYLVNGLTLTQLAERLNLTPHQLSQVLNEGFRENFYKFVNRYRVAESQRLLLDPALKHYNILGIAFESGFNSKSTFNKIFKEVTGLSPSEFQKENRRT